MCACFSHLYSHWGFSPASTSAVCVLRIALHAMHTLSNLHSVRQKTGAQTLCIRMIGSRYSTAGGKVSCVPRYPTVSHKFPRDILCPVVIRSISENFCDYMGHGCLPGIITEIFRHGWLPQNCRDTMSPVVICGIPWDTVRHGETLPPAVLYHTCEDCELLLSYWLTFEWYLL